MGKAACPLPAGVIPMSTRFMFMVSIGLIVVIAIVAISTYRPDVVADLIIAALK